MYQDGFDSTSPEAVQAARTMSSSRLRGILRDSWINNGIGKIPNAQPIQWCSSVDQANGIRATYGLSPLNPDHDPAPDLVEIASRQQPLGKPVAQSKLPVPAASMLPRFLDWTSSGRALIFLLAATSILCLIIDAEGYVTLRSFFFAILGPAYLALAAIAVLNRSKGDGQLFRAIKFGAIAGIVGAIVFFIFRMPFVYSQQLGLEQYGIRQYPFFNIYPRIGALILGQELKQPSYEFITYVIGWGYHLIRATSTGIMIAACVGELQTHLHASSARKPLSWETGLCGALLAVTIQSFLLLSPYAKLFSIQFTPSFVFTLLFAHISFGISIGFFYSWYSYYRYRSSPLPDRSSQ